MSQKPFLYLTYSFSAVSCLWSLWYTLLLLLPEFCLIQAPTWRGVCIGLGFDIIFYFSIAFVLCLMGEVICQINPTLSKGWHIVWHSLLYSYCASQFFLIYVFNLRWGTFVFQLINETTQSESLGFVKTYCFTKQFFWIVLGVACVIGVELLIYYVINSRYKKTISLGKLQSVTMSLLLIVTLSEFRFFSFDVDYNYYQADRYIKRNSLWAIWQSYIQKNRYEEDFLQCALSQQDVRIESLVIDSPNIVLIIGESYNKHHSNLYGYTINTCPKLSAEENLYVFSDVISSVNTTTQSFKNFMSMASVEDSIQWNEAPLFPSVFKAAGYNVVFYSNQFVVESEDEFYNSSAGFFNHPAISPSLFSHRNHKSYSKDLELIRDYSRTREEIEDDSLNLVIFHLAGQHFPPEMHFPASFSHFRMDDYSDREELTTQQKQEVANYDNATLYNDFVVDSIIDLYRQKDAIVLYFADHADEANDFRPRVGRSFDFDIAGPPCLRNQLDIPFLIFVSDIYKNNHPNIVEKIRSSVDKKFMTDDLPHLLLELAGIKSYWYKPERSIINPLFNSNRQRIVCDSGIDYDAVCG